MEELKTKIAELISQLEDTASKLDVPKKNQQITILEAKTSQSDFWTQENEAKETLQELSSLKEEVQQIQDLDKSLHELQELVSMASGDQADAALKAELGSEIKALARQFSKLEIQLFLTGKYDRNNAILSIHAGQGGVEAQDWAEMLQRMYLRFVEKSQWKYEVLHLSRGEEAGIKSVTILIRGKNVYGYLKNEKGTHRLVRLSPFNADNLRQTSFALVEVLPEIKDHDDVEIKDDDLEWSFFRSSGKGGQNVNKVSTAVRLTHKPTKITVESQAQRTQVQNRSLAMSLLTAKLWEVKEKKIQKTRQQIKGEHSHASFGSQIRSYVLHPYKLVKDNRTQVEVTDAGAVLDGDLFPFIEAQIKL